MLRAPASPRRTSSASTRTRAAKWADAVRQYESGGVYLAEGARLVHQCTYELPALKKEVSRAEKG